MKPCSDHPFPAFPTSWRLPADWKAVELLSDVHLCPDKPRTAQAFFQWVEDSTADALFLLGDLFDVWVGDDVLDVDGFERTCIQRLRAASERRPLFFLPGNRDFLVGERFHRESGCQALPDPCVLTAWDITLLVTHGDAWCLGDEDYQRFRAQVRDPAWRQAVLSRPLVERQMLARQIRGMSEHRKSEMGPGAYADVDPTHAAQWLVEARVDTLVHGHTHHPSSAPFAGGTMRHVLSDWEADEPPLRGDVLRWTPSGIERLAAVAADPAPAPQPR